MDHCKATDINRRADQQPAEFLPSLRP